MRAARKKKLILVMIIVSGVSIALMLVLLALGKNIDFFFTPSEVYAGMAPPDHTFRLGGLVKPGSVQQNATDLTVHFTVTDNVHEVPVIFHGILPDLFQAGKGVVAQGKLSAQQVFIASEVLAKHDNKYNPKTMTSNMSNRVPHAA